MWNNVRVKIKKIKMQQNDSMFVNIFANMVMVPLYVNIFANMVYICMYRIYPYHNELFKIII